MPPLRNWPFIATKEHRRFVEFADTVKRDRTIGICYGAAGIGKILSASRYARWDKAEHLLTTWGPREESDKDVYAALSRSRTVFYTPTVAATLREMRVDLKLICDRVNICIDQHVQAGTHRYQMPDYIQLLVIDESERLTANAIEHLRDRYDRGNHGLLFIGMPGIEKTFARYPQLYSRVGFAHHYRPLTGEELTFVLSRHWHKLGLQLTPTTSPTPKPCRGRPHHRRQLPPPTTTVSPKSNASCESTNSTPSPPTSSKPPAASWSSPPPEQPTATRQRENTATFRRESQQRTPRWRVSETRAG